MAGSASSATSPPSPPSPPSGPPRGTNFSRRKLTHPAPPSPPLTKMSISSTNIADQRRSDSAGTLSGGLLGDAHELVVAAALEAHVSVGLREEGVIDSDADVDAGFEARPALADEDAACRHELSAEPLDTQHLGVGVTAVPRAANTFLVGHGLYLDLGDAHRRHSLAMATMPPIVLQSL